jgi:hypothetical protein
MAIKTLFSSSFKTTIKEINSEFPQINVEKRKRKNWEDANKLAKLKLNEMKMEYPLVKYDTTLKKIKKHMLSKVLRQNIY